MDVEIAIVEISKQSRIAACVEIAVGKRRDCWVASPILRSLVSKNVGEVFIGNRLVLRLRTEGGSRPVKPCRISVFVFPSSGRSTGGIDAMNSIRDRSRNG